MRQTLIAATILALGLHGSLLADFEGTAYVGAGTVNIEFADGIDVDLSDWQNYPNALEGRLKYPLAQANGVQQITTIKGGFESDFYTRFLRVFLEADFGIPRSQNFGFWMLGAGLMLRPIDTPYFKLSFGPKASWTQVSYEIGAARQMARYSGGGNYVAPTIMPIGTVFDGDPISAAASGMTYQGLANIQIFFTRTLGISLEGGYSHSDLGEVKMKGGNVEIPRGNPAVVRPDGSWTAINVDPRIYIRGFTASGAIVYHFRL